MPTALPFNRLKTVETSWVTVYIEDLPIKVRRGDSAATAVLLAGLAASRTNPAKQSERLPYCLMGVCFECLLTIDGVENTQGCMTIVEEGMQIYPQLPMRSLSQDEGTSIDGNSAHVGHYGEGVETKASLRGRHSAAPLDTVSEESQ